LGVVSVSGTRIVGVCLLRNEQNFVLWSLMNIVNFCDEIIVLDNKSKDRTPELLQEIARRFGHVRIFEVEDAYDTHKYVEQFAGKNFWLFGVDGDEIYDPVGLERLRPRILAGELNDDWRIYGHSLHVVGIDWASSKAFGYGQPQARSITKLYNFNAISSWREGRHQRLHGKSMKFRPGYSLEKAGIVWNDVSWAESDLRCLHVCFVPRSPLDEGAEGRPNPSEFMKSAAFLRRAARFLRLPRLDSGRKRNYKQRFYAQGPIVSVDIGSFRRPTDWLQLDCEAPTVEALLALKANEEQAFLADANSFGEPPGRV
jgi:glycosyltransferase involved in cell wall biosynthesis